MSTFERMLSVLNATTSTATERLFFGSEGASPRGRGTAGTVTPSVVYRKRGKRRAGGDGSLSSESLEQRQLLAVSTFATPQDGGLVTIVAEGGDNVYIQQVATAPQSLYVADNSSFWGRTVVGGPTIAASSPGSFAKQLLAGQDFNTIDQILITSGTRRVESVPQFAQGYPMISPSVTRFTLSGPGLDTFVGLFEPVRLIEGTLALVQADGRTTKWNFSNFGNGLPVLTSGIGVTTTASVGEMYPTAIGIVDANNSFQNGQKSGVEFSWNVPTLSRVPTIERVAWSQNHETGSGNRTDLNVLPAGPAFEAFISLPNATGPGLNTIIPSSFSGRISVDGQFLFDITTSRDGTLYFNGQQRGVWRGAGFFEMSISGALVVGSEQNPETREYPRGIRLTTSGAVPLALLSAEYGVASGGAPVSATVFAGQDITAGLDINLLSPGSVINIDSPVLVPNTRAAHGVSLRASTIDLNAPITVKSLGLENKVKVGAQEFTLTTVTKAGRVDMGSPVAISQLGLETATAVAEIVGGKVSQVIVPVGFGGAGYDPASPPRVTISAPVNDTAEVQLTGLVNGSVSSVAILAGGSAYAAPPRVIFDDPSEAGGRVARAVAVVGAPPGSAVVGINLEDGGSGYTTAPSVRLVNAVGAAGGGASATATIVGSLSTGGLFISNGGFGYIPNSTLTLAITGTGSGAAGIARVDQLGVVSSVTITNGGTGYDLNNTRITLPDPPVSTGIRAEAEADIDPATGRVVGLKVVGDGGSGYGRIPTVTIAPPLAASSAAAPIATITGGSVSNIDFGSGRDLKLTVQNVSASGQVLAAYVAFGNGGTGYTNGSIVAIDSGATGSGRSAQFRILEVSRTGGVLRVEPISGGERYVVGETLAHDGVASRGRGYRATDPPRVWVARPDDPSGRQATAEAIVGIGGAIERFNIIDGGSGYSTAPLVTVAALTPLAVAETARFNAAIQAGIFDIDLADDPFTSTERAQLLVSQAGSLRSDVATAPALGIDAQVASSVRAEIHQGDVLIEGVVNAKNQSYLLASEVGDQHLAPFLFTTEAVGSGLQTGRILGGDVAVTLANDLPTPQSSAVAFNVVSLQTDVDSLRVRAARTNGAPITQPFPYRLDIQEQSDLAVDALAASSFPISFTANGNMNFNAALATAGGFAIAAQKNLTVNAPISTTYGQIVLSGRALTVGGSLRVTDEPADESRQDIVLDASSGAITLRGGVVHAPGRVVMRQKSGRVPSLRDFSAEGGATTIFTDQTISVPISVADDFFFDDLSVRISLAATNPAFSLSGLSADLVAPNGASYALFSRFAASGKAMTDTVFTPTARNQLFGPEPYTGSFRPISAASLEQLYNRFSARGTWRLNITSNTFSSNTPSQVLGSVSAVRLSLRDPVGAPAGNVYGTSRVIANSLLIDAEGAVGNPAVQPDSNEFYLQTDVTTVEGTTNSSFSLADINQVHVVSLRAGGLVSLRADGVDLPDGRAALKAELDDVPSLDASALAGSIDIEVTTARSLEIGNSQLLSLAAPFRKGLSPMAAAGNVKIRTLGGSQGGGITVLDAPLAGSSSRSVRFVAESPLQNAKYVSGVPGTFPDRVEPLTNGVLGSLFPGNPTLSIGDRILVAGGVNGAGERANGVYVVKSVGGVASKWQIVRASDADTLGELPSRTFVRPAEGNKAGQTYQVVHGIVTPQRFGLDPIVVTPVTLTNNIGSNDPVDVVSYVVSTSDGTNSSAGSLGKMISLRQLNDTSSSPNIVQQMDVLFSAGISSPIRLAQELPIITKAFAIDGRRRYQAAALQAPVVVDGSRIVTTRTNRSVGLTTPVDGFVFSQSAGGATAAALQGVIVGGFTRGAAVKVDGAANVLIDGVTVGLDDQGVRAANQKGIVVTSALAGGTNGVTIANSVIAGGVVAGLSLEGQASGVQIYGTKIGVANASNTVGISISSTGQNTIGNVAFAKNFISNNGTGMVLAAGAVTMINTQVSGNVADGIRINGGAHAIGRIARPQPRDSYANDIFGNGGFGVSFRDAATARNQVVVGNLIGAAGANRQGNVGVGGVVAPVAFGYVPNAKTGVDSKENLHLTVVATTPTVTPGRPTVTPGRPVGRPPVRRTPMAWRPRR